MTAALYDPILNPMKVMGHRGRRGEAPENTLRGIKEAIQMGCQVIEIDVHLTKDFHLVVIHDPTVDRTTNGEGAILNITFSEIKELDAGQGEKIPELKEVLSLVKELNCEIQIELKADHLEEKVVKEIENHGLIDCATVISFNHRFLKTIKKLNPQIKTACLLVGLPLDPVHMIKTAGADGISISTLTVDPLLVKEVSDAGFIVTVWNANEKAHFEAFKAMGVHIIGTDYPEKILKN